jgi:hypothetical protein
MSLSFGLCFGRMDVSFARSGAVNFNTGSFPISLLALAACSRLLWCRGRWTGNNEAQVAVTHRA